MPREAPPSPWWLNPGAWPPAGARVKLKDRPREALRGFVAKHHVALRKLWPTLTAIEPEGIVGRLMARHRSGVDLHELALIDLIATVMVYARPPTQIVASPPGGADWMGGLVGVKRMRGVEGWRRRSVDYQKLVRVRGVAAVALGVSRSHYGEPRIEVARRLVSMATGVLLSYSETRALASADLGVETLERRSAELAASMGQPENAASQR
jgi:hypothetical protein